MSTPTPTQNSPKMSTEELEARSKENKARGARISAQLVANLNKRVMEEEETEIN